MKVQKLPFGAIAVGALGDSIAGLTRDTTVPHQTMTIAGAQSKEGELSSRSTVTAWLNSPQVTADGLRGKVALIDLWT